MKAERNPETILITALQNRQRLLRLKELMLIFLQKFFVHYDRERSTYRQTSAQR